jgi:hypothetical protein
MLEAIFFVLGFLSAYLIQILILREMRDSIKTIERKYFTLLDVIQQWQRKV